MWLILVHLYLSRLSRITRGWNKGFYLGSLDNCDTDREVVTQVSKMYNIKPRVGGYANGIKRFQDSSWYNFYTPLTAKAGFDRFKKHQLASRVRVTCFKQHCFNNTLISALKIILDNYEHNWPIAWPWPFPNYIYIYIFINLVSCLYPCHIITEGRIVLPMFVHLFIHHVHPFTFLLICLHLLAVTSLSHGNITLWKWASTGPLLP